MRGRVGRGIDTSAVAASDPARRGHVARRRRAAKRSILVLLLALGAAPALASGAPQAGAPAPASGATQAGALVPASGGMPAAALVAPGGDMQVLPLSGAAWRGTLDASGARVAYAESSGVPWLPGRGNTLAGPAPQDVVAALEARARAFLDENRAAFALDGFALRRDDARTRALGPAHWLVVFDVLADGLVVQDAELRFVVSHGNLVSVASDLPPAPPVAAAQGQGARVARAFVAPRRLTLRSGRVLDDPRWGDGTIALSFDGTRYAPVWRGVVADAASGEAFDVVLSLASGAVLRETPLRAPAQAIGGVLLRSAYEPQTMLPLGNLEVGDDTDVTVTDAAGRYALPGDVLGGLSGPYVRIADGCGTTTLGAAAGSDLDFAASTSGDCASPLEGAPGDTTAARTTAFHLNRMRDLYKALDPVTPWLDTPLDVITNSKVTCVNYYDANADLLVLNWRGTSTHCANAGENPGLLYHEWAHAYQWNQKGFFADAGTREGYADVSSFLQRRSSCLFDGFFLDTAEGGCSGGRSLDFTLLSPPVPARPDTIAASPYSCPIDGGGVAGYQGHCESAILSQAVYELALAMQARYGVATGMQRLLEMWIAAGPMQTSGWRVVDAGPPLRGDGCAAGSWYRTLRAADDDDGDLLGGVPDESLLFDAFDRHGIACGSRDTLPPDTTTCPAIDAPVTTLGHDPVSDAILLQWSAVEGASGYQIARSELGPDGPFTPVATVAADQLEMIDAQGTARAAHWYVVRTLHEDGCASGLEGALASTSCALPVTLAEPFAGDLVTGDVLTLSWTRVENAAEHELLLGPDVAALRSFGGTTGTSRALASAFLEPGFPYVWQVRTRATDAACDAVTSATRVVTVAGDAVAPQVTSVLPSAGSNPGEVQVQVDGANLFLGAEVWLGGVRATLLRHDGPDQLVAFAAGMAPGPIELRIVNPSGAELRWVAFAYHAALDGESLLQNGSLEMPDAERALPPPWEFGGSAPPAIVCGVPKRFVNSGACAVRFAGAPRPNGKRGRGVVRQWVVVPPGTSPSDLRLRIAVRAKNVPANGRGSVLIGLHAAGAPVEKLTVQLRGGSYGYRTYEATLHPTQSYDAISVEVVYKASSGRLWIDDVSLERVAGGE